jgi:unconventional prefoldin RPB5 interactor 1
MRELEAKLNARGLLNMGKDISALPAEMQQELETLAVAEIKKAEDPTDATLQPKKPKKKVAFATELDIAPTESPVSGEKEAPPPREADVPVLSDSVVERTEPAEKITSTTESPKKSSRFKNARKAAAGTATGDSTVPVPPSTSRPHRTEPHSTIRQPGAAPSPSSLPLFPAKPTEPKPFSQPISDVTEKPSTPRPPENKILADTLLERAISEGSATAPQADELDEQLHRKEIATEFYKMRNRQIQQNGGFLKDDEPAVELVGADDAPKRVSKFRAARMNQQS